MNSPKIRAGAVRLRRHVESDKAAYLAAPRNPDFYSLLGSEYPHDVSREDETNVWYERKTHPEHSWAIEVDNRCIGSVWLHSIEPTNRRARFAIEIFDQRYWGRGVGTISTKALVKFAFEQLKLHRLDLRVLTENERAIRCYMKCGFVREGVQRDTVFSGGLWHSDLWMSILECEYQGQVAAETSQKRKHRKPLDE